MKALLDFFFFDTKQKVLFCVSMVILSGASIATIAYVKRPPELPPEIQKVVPLEAPSIIELEDDAGVGK